VSALVVALSLTALLGAGALVIDLGCQRLVGHQLQAGVDAAALAGAAHLSGGPDDARYAATVLAGRNLVGASAITVETTDIDLGAWDADTRSFTDLAVGEEDEATAVRVTKVDTSFHATLGAVFGAGTLGVKRSSIATVAGGAVCGVLADSAAVINGNWSTDSYASRLGAYGPGNQGSNSGVCSNGDITAQGNARIYGALHDGVDPGDTTSVSGSVTVTGGVSQLPEEIPMPSASSAYARTHNNNSRIPKTSRGRTAVSGTSLSLNSTDILTLSAGTYYFTAFSINGGAELRTTGNVIIYMAGDMHVNGRGIANQTQAPANLTIYVDGARSVELNGSANFYGSVIAPRSESHINGNADVYGMVVSNRIELNGNGKMHVDLAMVEGRLGAI